LNIRNVRKNTSSWSGRQVTSVLVVSLLLQSSIVFSNEFQNISPKPSHQSQLTLDVKALSGQQRCVQVIWVSTMEMPEQNPEFRPSNQVILDLGAQCAPLWSAIETKNVRYFLMQGALFDPFDVSQHWHLGTDRFTATAHWPNVRAVNSKRSFSVGGSQPAGGFHVIRLGEDR
jgi:hypothetical protein